LSLLSTYGLSQAHNNNSSPQHSIDSLKNVLKTQH
jgi:hypothetical protein